jgi:hypothetical protein
MNVHHIALLVFISESMVLTNFSRLDSARGGLWLSVLPPFPGCFALLTVSAVCAAISRCRAPLSGTSTQLYKHLRTRLSIKVRRGEQDVMASEVPEAYFTAQAFHHAGMSLRLLAEQTTQKSVRNFSGNMLELPGGNIPSVNKHQHSHAPRY